jgi:lipid-A-disaccharide synthase-like uncharacterized protein
MTDATRLFTDLWQVLWGMSLWVKIGFLGQFAFTARFLVQWIASEKKRDSVMPVAFWWLSLVGGSILLAYAIHRRDPVIIVGQAMGLLVYIRNLMLVERARRRAATRKKKAQAEPNWGSKPHRVDTADRRVPFA